MKSSALVWLVLSLSYTCSAQKKVLNYPFEFEKSFLQKGQYDAYFLENRDRGNFAFILRDNKKANYVLVDGRFKVATEFTKRPEETVFNHDAVMYLGGTCTGNTFHFVFKVTDKKFIGANTITYMMESVDFGAGRVSDDKAFEIPKEEELLVSFSDHNRYFTITANKKTSDLQFYQVSADGQATSKTLHFNIPPGIKKDKNELTGYLAGLKLIREDEEPGLDLATHRAKLFCYADKLVFTVPGIRWGR
ncbi:MAG: hypothetical protein Q8927_02525 [Bacteroidota bacterium]|nr:hypothetical protein [Bacteroidota bacterium]MDP4215048.1 hypothetical protein [Bacteroidota bacterium]MDP4244279.1 hypothetical protein [Bacteroidota bacterium]MDP4252791.1 hypothetical protein [Bacteroidota bacterium]MDP4257524.1 hypothetical protein [Bacteroidota bacterium]